MTDIWSDPDAQQQPDSGQDNSPGGLRKALEAANRKFETAQRENAELKQQVRRSTLSSALSANGVDPKRFAQHVPADLDPTDEAVKSWIKENQDVFNFGTVAPAGATPAPGEQQSQAPANQQQQSNPDEQVSTDPLSGIDPNLITALTKIGLLSDRTQALSGAERAQLAEQVAAATPKSLDDAKAVLAGLGIELQDTGGYRF